MLLSKKIKLEVSEQDAATLEFMQGKCRALYNWWVMRLRNGERWNFAQAKRSLQESKQFDPGVHAEQVSRSLQLVGDALAKWGALELCPSQALSARKQAI